MALCEVRVHVLSGRDVKRPNNYSQIYPVAVVSVPGLNRQTQQTAASKRPDDPRWDEVLVFNVPLERLEPDKMVSVKVFADADLGWFCGEAQIPVMGKDELPHRYPLVDPAGRTHGLVKVGIVVAQAPPQSTPPPTIRPSQPSSSRPSSKSAKNSCPADLFQAPNSSAKPGVSIKRQDPTSSVRQGLSVMTMDDVDTRKPSTVAQYQNLARGSNQKVQGQSQQRQTLSGAGRSSTAGAGSTRSSQSSGKSYPAPYITSSHPPPPAHYGAPPPGYPVAPPPGYHGAPPPPAYTHYPPSQPYVPQGSAMTAGGGFARLDPPAPKKRMGGAGAMMAGAAVGAGVGILGGMAVAEVIDDLDDYDDDDDFF